MVRLLEIVLDVIPAAPGGGIAGAGKGGKAGGGDAGNGGQPGSAAAALAKALTAALPQLVPLGDERVTTALFDRDAALARAGWRIAVETRASRRRVAVSQRQSLTPGMTAITPHFEAPLKTDGLTDALFDDAPQPFRAALADCGELVPAATLHSERRRWQWNRDGIEAELVLDAALHDPGAPPQSARPLHELRVRAPWPEDADPAPLVDLLFACAHDLVDAAPASLPALVRLTDAPARAAAGNLAGDGEAVHARPIDLDGAKTALAAFVAIGRNITEQWFGNDAGVRDSARPEFIHQMRVSQRRLRTAMRIFSDWRDDTWTERIKPDLKWLGRLLGDARDRDVLADATLPALAGADAAETITKADPARVAEVAQTTARAAGHWDALRAQADAARRAAHERVREALASPRYAHVALAWLQWLAVLERRASAQGAGERSLRKHARKQARRFHGRLAKMPKLTTIDEPSRHLVRINGKYLRYTLEFFAPIMSHRTRTKTLRTLARLQAVLGDGNDVAVALRLLEELEVEPYQLGFVRGWRAALSRNSAAEGERLLRELRRPKLLGR